MKVADRRKMSEKRRVLNLTGVEFNHDVPFHEIYEPRHPEKVLEWLTFKYPSDAQNFIGRFNRAEDLADYCKEEEDDTDFVLIEPPVFFAWFLDDALKRFGLRVFYWHERLGMI